eukprot:gene48826-6019_t
MQAGSIAGPHVGAPATHRTVRPAVPHAANDGGLHPRPVLSRGADRYGAPAVLRRDQRSRPCATADAAVTQPCGTADAGRDWAAGASALRLRAAPHGDGCPTPRTGTLPPPPPAVAFSGTLTQLAGCGAGGALGVAPAPRYRGGGPVVFGGAVAGAFAVAPPAGGWGGDAPAPPPAAWALRCGGGGRA